MSTYIPLFLKYRSQKFSELIGQDVSVRVLTAAVIKNRLSGAILFTGIRGTGKTSTARILARALNCPNRPETSAEPCCMCKTCQDILGERHMDVIEIDAASHTSVDDVRELIESCKYKPVECKYKIYIIDEVHMLSKSAFNALLKTLEEPPPHVKFLFATTETYRVPETVLSRCLKFDLKPIPVNLLAQHLANILNQEGVSADVEALNIIARASGGSARDSISILEQAINFCEKVSVEAVKTLLGHGDYAVVYEAVKACLLGDAKNSIVKFREYSKSGGLPAELINRMLEIVHWLTCKKTSIQPFDDNFAQGELKNDLENSVLPKMSVAGLSRMWQACFRALEEIKLAPQPDYATEAILIRLCYLAKLPELTDILSSLDKNRPETGICQLKEVEPKTELQTITDIDSLLECLTKNREAILLNELKQCAAVAECNPPILVLAQKQKLSDGFEKRLEMTLSRLTNEKWHVTISSDNPSLLSISEQDKIRQSEEISAIEKSDFIRTAKDLFPQAKLKITKKE
ncbi:MAG: DNA polymerase III subunit gamma/tau [Holosporales bacterium]|nr:DNA polymerase III subunit gamma/tau [Holosporales bacterium]